jgi:NAD(P)-dependent dehydrogenase (short-subunit alcohol dehydrogenase family)
MRVAVITGASAGLGRALAAALADRGWITIVDARGAETLAAAAAGFARGAQVVAIPGDVTDPKHRAELIDAAKRFGRLDLIVNNASYLGPSPQPPLADYPTDELRRVYDADVFAPVALIQEALPLVSASAGTIVNVSSDAAVEPYAVWGGYGSAKAALDQATALLGAELPHLTVYAFDPGDMRTAMHQRAYPGEDISDRPEPESVVPSFLRLIEERPASGRYRAADLTTSIGASA